LRNGIHDFEKEKINANNSITQLEREILNFSNILPSFEREHYLKMYGTTDPDDFVENLWKPF
jgi:hypothetical protein